MRHLVDFKLWLEGWQEFGFTNKSQESKPLESENPIDTFDIEYMRNMLVERKIGPYSATSRFVDEVTWGNQMGSLRLSVTPCYGIVLERLGLDLLGNPRWYCKKYFQINREGYGGYEEVVTQELFDYLQKIYKTPPESAKKDPGDIEGLVIKMAERIKSTMRPIFLFDEVRRINDHRYIISLNVRGQGVQAMDQARVSRNHTEVTFDANEGVFRIWNTNLENKVGRNVSPQVTPSHADLVFFPSQDWDEIISPISTVLRFF